MVDGAILSTERGAESLEEPLREAMSALQEMENCPSPLFGSH
jgi:hypothetical protein